MSCSKYKGKIIPLSLVSHNRHSVGITLEKRHFMLDLKKPQHQEIKATTKEDYNKE